MKITRKQLKKLIKESMGYYSHITSHDVAYNPNVALQQAKTEYQMGNRAVHRLIDELDQMAEDISWYTERGYTVNDVINNNLNVNIDIVKALYNLYIHQGKSIHYLLGLP